MTTERPTPPSSRPTPPPAGQRVSVRVDDVMHDALAVIMGTGMTASDAIRAALNVLADACEGAWDGGHYPEWVLPQRYGITYPDAPGRPTDH